ncbi:MAG: nucleoside phosphorylase [Candidatus Thorarchaeota archaeon]
MPFPNYKDKFREDSLFRARDFWHYKKELKIYPDIDPPKGVIFTFQTKLIDYIINNYPLKKVAHVFHDFYIIEDHNCSIGITSNFGIGAPIAAILLEELAAFGIKNFISVGTAGALQKDLKLGSLVLCEKAIRDEGTSYHYLEDEKYAYPSESLTQSVKQTIEKLGKEYSFGTSWTVDAPYRETIKEIEQYKEEGVLTVDMESSAVFAVAKYLNVDVASIFTISDYFKEKEWKPYFHLTEKHLIILFEIALETLKTI